MAEAGLNTRAEVLSPAEGGDVAEYFALMKPRVMFLVVFTALVGLVAAPGHMHPVLAVAALLCIAVGAGAAGALNMWYDADIDARMARTSARPIPRGRITADEARAFGTVLAIGSVICLGLMANWVAAGLLALTIAFYVFVYTMWLKRSTPQNIVIGGAAGAFPPLVGWASVTNRLDLAALYLFLIIFYWTPPHFWALALYRTDDYRKSGLPMLPVTHGSEFTRLHIVLYTIALVAVTMLPFSIRMSGWLYLVSALALGTAFLTYAVQLQRAYSDALARRTFRFSIVYLSLLFIALLVDHYFRW
jgi:protoheme IX farnesyltransferase